MSSWKAKLSSAPHKPASKPAVVEMTVADLLGSLKPAQLWASLVAMATAPAGAFALGAKLIP